MEGGENKKAKKTKKTKKAKKGKKRQKFFLSNRERERERERERDCHVGIENSKLTCRVIDVRKIYAIKVR